MSLGWAVVAVVYVAGVVWGLLASDARPAERLVLGLLWPLGSIAFAVTVTLLVAVAVVVFPLVAVPVLAAAGLLWWAFL